MRKEESDDGDNPDQASAGPATANFGQAADRRGGPSCRTVPLDGLVVRALVVAVLGSTLMVAF